MGNPLRFAFSFLAAFALTLSVALAQDPGSFYKPPSKVTTSAVGTNPTGKSAAGGIAALLTMQGVDDSGRSAAYKSRSINYSPSTLGKLGRALGGPGGLLGLVAFTALVDAAGWAIDELTGQVMLPGYGDPPPPAGNAVWCTASWGASFNRTMCASSPESFVGMNPGWGAGYTVTAYIPSSSTIGTLQVNSGQVGGMTVQVYAYQPGTYDWLTYTPPSPVPEADVDNLVGNEIANRPDTWNEALRHPDGRPRVTPEVQQALDEYQQELELENGITPSPDTPVDPDFATAPNETATDLPGFCAWASVVCEFIDWYRSPPDTGADVELPVTEIPVTPSTWTSGLGSGSCPANSSLSLSVWQGSISYQPVCDLASYIRPLVILSALLIGAFIISGANKQNV